MRRIMLSVYLLTAAALLTVACGQSVMRLDEDGGKSVLENIISAVGNSSAPNSNNTTNSTGLAANDTANVTVNVTTNATTNATTNSTTNATTNATEPVATSKTNSDLSSWGRKPNTLRPDQELNLVQL